MEHKYTTTDKIVKAALEDLKVPFNPQHWDVFEQELDAAAEANPDGLFDAAIAGRLANVDAGGWPADWDFFEQKLEAAEAVESDAIDEVVYSNLNNLEAPFNPTHWALMKERLEAVFALRVYVLRSKIFEATLLLLAVVALLQVLPGGVEWPSSIQNRQPASPVAGSEAAELGRMATKEQTGVLNAAPPASTATPVQEQQTPGETTAATLSVTETAEAIAIAAATSGRHPIAANHSETDRVTTTALPTIGISPLSIRMPALPIFTRPALVQSTALQAFQTLPTSSFGWVESTSTTSLDITTKPVNALVKKGLRVGIIGSFDYNTIHSPFDEVFNIGPRSTDSIGMGYGLALGYRINRWEIEMGALYTTKNYRPLVPVQQYGTFDYLVVEEFEGIHLEELEIPLNVRFNLNPKAHRWHAYAVAGLTTNLVLKPIYQIRQAELLSKELAAAPAPSKAEREEEVQERSLLNEKKFSQGLLEGGALRDNIYFSYNLGMSLERNIDERWSLFVEPTFINQLRVSSGIGPNNDRFSKFALRFGTKVQVWGK